MWFTPVLITLLSVLILRIAERILVAVQGITTGGLKVMAHMSFENSESSFCGADDGFGDRCIEDSD